MESQPESGVQGTVLLGAADMGVVCKVNGWYVYSVIKLIAIKRYKQ